MPTRRVYLKYVVLQYVHTGSTAERNNVKNLVDYFISHGTPREWDNVYGKYVDELVE